MNDLTEEKRQMLKKAVVLIVIIFILLYGAFIVIKYSREYDNINVNVKNNQIIFKQPKLKFPHFSIDLNTYPDRIAIHYPYLIVVRPDQFRSEIYNMEADRKEKEVNEVILDYFNGDIVYNKQGFQTYFNKKDLGLLCDQAFIQSKTEILCITRPDQNKEDNKLILINPETLKQNDVYTSQNVLTAVYSDKTSIYIGEYDFAKNKAHIIVNSKTVPTSDLVNMFYPMGNSMYAASFKSKRNKMNESYSEIISTNNYIQSKIINKGEIILH